jgi:hypothetical protein
VGAPLTYELECGHCGCRFTQQFTPDERASTRHVRCPICGGVLTIAIPVPLVRARPVPSATPPADPKPPPRPSPVPPLPHEPEIESSTLPPELRARHLEPPWPTVYTGLARARNAVYLALPLSFVLLILDLGVRPLADSGDEHFVTNVMLVLLVTQLLPIFVHLTGLIACTAAPVSHGGELARSSARLVGAAALLVTGIVLSGQWLFGLFAAVVLLVFACGVWLGFLERLGRGLGDPELVREVQSYARCFWIGVLVGFLLPGAVAFSEYRSGGSVGWGWRVAAGVWSIWLLIGYLALIRTACRAVAQRAPMRREG